MAQWVKNLLCKRENLVQIFSAYTKSWDASRPWPASLAESVISKFSETLSYDSNMDNDRGSCPVLIWPPQGCTHVLLHIYMPVITHVHTHCICQTH